MVLVVADRMRIDAELVQHLIASQFPNWSDLPVRAVTQQGWDNRTFRVGSELVARMPTDERVERQAAVEAEVLPMLAADVSVRIPEIVVAGRADEVYPYRWTVLRWLDGTPMRDELAVDLQVLAADVAGFLTELRSISPFGGPAHGVGLGRPLEQWNAQVRAVLDVPREDVDADRAREVWRSALEAQMLGGPQWFHGDIAPGNLLLEDGHLSAVIDFGAVGVGDPACDLAFAWMVLDEDARAVFRSLLTPDDAEWARGMGWALWFGLTRIDDADDGATARHALEGLSVLQ